MQGQQASHECRVGREETWVTGKGRDAHHKGRRVHALRKRCGAVQCRWKSSKSGCSCMRVVVGGRRDMVQGVQDVVRGTRGGCRVGGRDAACSRWCGGQRPLAVLAAMIPVAASSSQSRGQSGFSFMLTFATQQARTVGGESFFSRCRSEEGRKQDWVDHAELSQPRTQAVEMRRQDRVVNAARRGNSTRRLRASCWGRELGRGGGASRRLVPRVTVPVAAGVPDEAPQPLTIPCRAVGAAGR